MNEDEIRKLDELKLRVTEYEQLSADWRHRDVLTWQMPAVLLVIAGVLVGEGFDLLNSKVNPWVVETLFAFAAAFAIMLTIALRQNLVLQDENRVNLERINPYTRRFGFPLWGSGTLYYLSFAISGALILLNIMTLLLICVPGAKRALLNVS
jgi:hypothetical protein